MRLFDLHLLFSPLYILVSSSGPTPIFIDQVSDYVNLSACAESAVSTIVRNMAFGCGDGGRTTSIACFCYSASAKYTSMIGKHVSTACPQDLSQISSALAVFSGYCQLAEDAGVTSDLNTLGLASLTSTALGTPVSLTWTTSASPAPGSTTFRPEATDAATATSQDNAATRHAGSTTTGLEGTGTATRSRDLPTSTQSGSGTENDNSDSGTSLSNKIALGVGIGIGLPGTIATIATVFLMRRRRSH